MGRELVENFPPNKPSGKKVSLPIGRQALKNTFDPYYSLYPGYAKMESSIHKKSIREV
jgi:hypothetical protein